MVVVVGVVAAGFFKVFEVVGVVGGRACGEEKIVTSAWTAAADGRSMVVVFAVGGFKEGLVVGMGVEIGVRCVVSCSRLWGV